MRSRTALGELGCRAPGAPVAQITRGDGCRYGVARGPDLVVLLGEPCNSIIDLGQSFGRDQIGVRGDGALRQQITLLVCIVLSGERLARRPIAFSLRASIAYCNPIVGTAAGSCSNVH